MSYHVKQRKNYTICNHFQNAHTHTHTQQTHGSKIINRIIIFETVKLKNEIEQDISLNKTVFIFSNENTSNYHKQPDTEINYFTNYNQLKIIFSKLNNKRPTKSNNITQCSLNMQ